MAVVLDHMAIREAGAILRWYEVLPDERHADLTAMGMAGERQRDAGRHFGKNIRLVDQQQHGIVGLDLRQRARKVVDTAELATAERVSDLIAEPCEPEPLSGFTQQHRFVFQ